MLKDIDIDIDDDDDDTGEEVGSWVMPGRERNSEGRERLTYLEGRKEWLPTDGLIQSNIAIWSVVMTPCKRDRVGGRGEEQERLGVRKRDSKGGEISVGERRVQWDSEAEKINK